MGLFDHLPAAYFYAKDEESRYVKLNRLTYNEIFGVEREEEVLGRTDREFQPPALAEAYLAEDRRVMDSGEAIPNQVWLVPASRGAPRWYVSTKTPLLGSGGEVMGIAGVMYPIATPQEQEKSFRELAPVIRHIDTHFTEVISMGAMAELAGLSATHFHRLFRSLLKLSPTEYLQKRRVQEAQRLLTETGASVGEVAVTVGFYDQSHFTKIFKRVTGMAPLGYRRRFR